MCKTEGRGRPGVGALSTRGEKDLRSTSLIIAGLLTVHGLAGLPSASRADEATDDVVQLLVESADTPQEHAALAKFYRSKAKEQRKEAERHRGMAKHYTGKLTTVAAMKEHCEKTAALSDQLAAEYEALAKSHEDLAK